MIQPLPVLLARAKRQRQPLLLCEVSAIEQIQGCLDAASEQKSALALTLSAATRHQLDRVVELMPLAQFLAQDCPQAIAMEARLTTPLLGEMRAFNRFPHLCLTLPASLDQALPTGDLAATCSSVSAAEKADAGFHALRVPASLSRIGLAEALRDLKRPLILEEASLSPARLKAIARSGIAGISLAEQLDASFTAGVRAALRNRELNEPAGYLAKGRLSVKGRVLNYLQYLAA